MAIETDRIYTVATAAEATDCSETFIRKQIDAGKLKARYFGRKIKIKGGDLQQWFDDQPLVSEFTPSSEEEKLAGEPSGKRPMDRTVLTSISR